jgi:hypothetical protein
VHVAVAIVGYRNADDIAHCLEALAASTHTDFEVVVCENGGAAAFAALADMPRRLAGGQSVKIVQAERNLGYAGGVNRAMAEAADADAWWVLNPDTLPEPDAMAALVARLEAGDCAAVGCTVIQGDGRVQSHGGAWRPWLARAISIGWGEPAQAAPPQAEVERRQNYLNGACLLVGRRFLEVAGPMREEYFLYCEEVEWCLRAQARGLRLGFSQDARVLHHVGATTGSNLDLKTQPRLPIYLGERNKILVTRDCFPARLPVAAVAALLLIGVRHVRRGAWKQMGYALAGWAAGLANRRGPPAGVPA